MKKMKSIVGALGLATALLVGSGCASDVANNALKNAGVSVNGNVPADFPKADVPLPTGKLETAVGAVGSFTFRYTSTDPKGDVASYKSALTAKGFTITGEADNLGNATACGNIAFLATSAKYSVAVSAFDASAPGGGNYMGVVVTPAA
jgi:hypothetical protein